MSEDEFIEIVCEVRGIDRDNLNPEWIKSRFAVVKNSTGEQFRKALEEQAATGDGLIVIDRKPGESAE